MKRLVWLPIAGFLLIAGAAVAAAAPSLVDQARTVFGTGVQDDSGTITVGTGLAHPGHDLLAEVLADLVGDGTITQAQSDAITTALVDRVDALKADMEARRELFESFVEDGVITQAEIDQLPADDPLRVAFDSIANDGQITLDQLHGFGPGFGPGHHGRGPGGFMWVGPGPADESDPNASPSAN